MNDDLKKDFQYYLDNQDKLLKQYNGKFVVIKNQEVLGAYDSEVEAIDATTSEHELGTFLIQKCEPGTDSYTQTYHSRVSFG